MIFLTVIQIQRGQPWNHTHNPHSFQQVVVTYLGAYTDRCNNDNQKEAIDLRGSKEGTQEKLEEGDMGWNGKNMGKGKGRYSLIKMFFNLKNC